jgi:hypothetical protein
VAVAVQGQMAAAVAGVFARGGFSDTMLHRLLRAQSQVDQALRARNPQASDPLAQTLHFAFDSVRRWLAYCCVHLAGALEHANWWLPAGPSEVVHGHPSVLQMNFTPTGEPEREEPDRSEDRDPDVLETELHAAAHDPAQVGTPADAEQDELETRNADLLWEDDSPDDLDFDGEEDELDLDGEDVDAPTLGRSPVGSGREKAPGPN